MKIIKTFTTETLYKAFFFIFSIFAFTYTSFSLEAASVSSEHQYQKVPSMIPDYTYKISLVGDHSVGKTALFERIKNKKFVNNTLHTANPDVAEHFIKLNNKLIKLNISDTGGQEQFARLTRSVYNKTDCLVLCYDITYKNSFDSCQDRWFKEIEDYCDNVKSLIICATKCDQSEYRTLFEGDSEKLKEFFKNKKIFEDIYTVETSAKEDINIKQLVETMASSLLLYEPKKYGNLEIKRGDVVKYDNKVTQVVEVMDTRFRVRLHDNTTEMIKNNFDEVTIIKSSSDRTSYYVDLSKMTPPPASGMCSCSYFG